MPTYFDGVKSYATVSITSTDDGIEVASFLEATEGVIALFDSLGSAFGVVKSDMTGNVAKIRTKYNENPAKYATLQLLVLGELAEKKRTAAEGLLWLKRTLEFTALGLRKNFDSPTKEELSVSFNAAYTTTLSPYHNFLIRPVFAMAMKACPYRADFYQKLGSSEPNFDEQFRTWLAALEKIVAILVAFFTKNGINEKEPVVSKKSGNVYEKRLILKYLADGGKEPGTGEPLTEDDLIAVKTTKIIKPRPPTVNSVPALLSLLQNEWDSVMLETYQLKQQYQQLRQELSNALYENDAAKRVIARLAKERDQARESLAAITAATAVAAPTPAAAQTATAETAAMDVDEAPPTAALPAEAVQKLEATAQELSKTRKKRKPAPETAAVEDIKSFKQISELTALHSSTNPGIVSLGLLVDNDGEEKKEWVLTGGKDGSVLVHDIRSEKQVISIKAHTTKKVTSTVWIDKGSNKGNGFITASADKTAKVWQFENDRKGNPTAKASATFKGHTSDVTDLSLHPTGDYFASCSNDSTWAFNDIDAGKQILRISDPETSDGYNSISFHPDGLLIGTGTNTGVVRIWEAKSGNNVTSFSGHEGKISSISFSENGYYLATTSGAQSVVKLWDLRKLTNFHTIDLAPHGVSSVTKAAFDSSAQYLGVAAGSSIWVFLNKQWDELVKVAPHSSEVTDFAFGENSKYIVSSGNDRKVVISGV
ncbi:hypothetical protein HDV05_008067 [Chytridiales sp. JEL 0842]|nr:hypothetical protein HDV05_008067 [Chytridiales sp. JEL 0842]